MIQAIGLTSTPRRRQRPAVDDLTFEARAGAVTMLLGPEGAGRTSTLELLLQLRSGLGLALFNGRPVHRIPHLAREVGVLLGDVSGHPARTARSHLRMLTAAAGVPVPRADEVLDVAGLSGLAEQRLGNFSLGMDRRLGLASALLGDPHTLVLDEPTLDLSPRETVWVHSLLRAYAEQGGSVLVTSGDPKEAVRLADRVITLDEGRLVADQTVADFARARLRPRVAVVTPHADRLCALLEQEARSAGRAGIRGDSPLEVVREGGSRLSVFGSSCSEVGEIAHRKGILIHQLADETGNAGDAFVPGPLARADGRDQRLAPEPAAAPGSGRELTAVAAASGPAAAAVTETAEPPELPEPSDSSGPSREPSAGEGGSALTDTAEIPVITDATSRPAAPTPVSRGAAAPRPEPAVPSPFKRRLWGATQEEAELPSRLPCVSRPGPVAPLAYEMRRLFGVRTTWFLLVGTVLATVGLALVMATTGPHPAVATASGTPPGLRLLMGWPASVLLPLPPAALAAGLLGALSFGQEFRYPALAPARSAVPRRLGMLFAKLGVSALLAVGLCTAVLFVNAVVLLVALGPTAFTVAAEGSGELRTLAAGSGAGGPSGAELQLLSLLLLFVGCAWAGLLAAGVFRSTLVGLAAVVMIPVFVAPSVAQFLSSPAAASLEGLPERLQRTLLVPWPAGMDDWTAAVVRLAVQPVGRAMVLSLGLLLVAYLFTSLRGRTR